MKRRRLFIILAVLLAAAGLAVLLTGKAGDETVPVAPPRTTPTTTTPPATTTTTPETAKPEIGKRPTGEREIRSGDLSFDLPKNARNIQDVSVPQAPEVRFETGDHAARVRVQPAAGEDSLSSLAADYAGQGTVTRATLGGQTGVLVVSPSPPYVSQLFVTVRGGRLYYTQVLSRRGDRADGRALIARLHGTLKLKTRG